MLVKANNNVRDEDTYVIGARLLAGSIDEAGIWSRALSGTEITELYNAGAGITYPFSILTLKFFQLF